MGSKLRKPYCRCGVLKTPETTSINHLGQYHYLCKVCDSLRVLKDRLAKMPISQLREIAVRHSQNLINVLDELKRRGEKKS